MSVPVSVQILTFNRIRSIRRCLESVRWADEVVVVDSGSTDGTLEVARELADRLLERPFVDAADQHRWAMPQLKHDWVLVVDSDEWATPELAAAIQSLLAAGPEHAGYWIRRRSVFLGREILFSGWQRDRIVRFFDRRRGGYVERRVHSTPEIQGTLGSLSGFLMHEPYEHVDDYLKRIQRFTTLGAEDAFRAGRPFRRTDLVLRPWWRFIRHYLLMQGFRDGLHGFVLSAMTSYYVFVKYLKLWELRRKQGR